MSKPKPAPEGQAVEFRLEDTRGAWESSLPWAREILVARMEAQPKPRRSKGHPFG